MEMATLLLSAYALLAPPTTGAGWRMGASWRRTTPSALRCSASSADVIVIGGGHAGCEAAAAAARTGADTILLTQRLDTIGEMSCNPSIGGIGKGHLVREVDALDGLMARVTDEAGIHFRVLNRRKGPAVQGPRAQADRDLYRSAMLESILAVDGLRIVEASAEDLIVKRTSKGEWRVDGVVTESGEELLAPRVVLTTGTFLRGIVHIGRESRPAGRYLRDSDGLEPPCTVRHTTPPPPPPLATTTRRHDHSAETAAPHSAIASLSLSQALGATLEKLLGLPLGRLKTGTPARLDGDTIEWSILEDQPSETPPLPFSYMNADRGVAQADRLITCHKTHTNAETHRIVTENAHTLPAYESGEGKGAGPRYCPSLYSKVRNPHPRPHPDHLALSPSRPLSLPLVPYARISGGAIRRSRLTHGLARA